MSFYLGFVQLKGIDIKFHRFISTLKLKQSTFYNSSAFNYTRFEIIGEILRKTYLSKFNFIKI